jgi:hypothetical protein
MSALVSNTDYPINVGQLIDYLQQQLESGDVTREDYFHLYLEIENEDGYFVHTSRPLIKAEFDWGLLMLHCEPIDQESLS